MATTAPAPALPGSGLDPAPILAHLSVQHGVQRVPSPKVTLFLRRGFLSPDVCSALIERIDAGRRPSTISDDIGDAAFRTSETCDLDSGDPIVAQVEAAIGALTGLDARFGEPLQGQRYAVGQESRATPTISSRAARITQNIAASPVIGRGPS